MEEGPGSAFRVQALGFRVQGFARMRLKGVGATAYLWMPPSPVWVMFVIWLGFGGML